MVLEATQKGHESGCSKSWEQNSKDLISVHEALSGLSRTLGEMREDVTAKHVENGKKYETLKSRLVIAGLLLLLAIFGNGKGLDLAKHVIGF